MAAQIEAKLAAMAFRIHGPVPRMCGVQSSTPAPRLACATQKHLLTRRLGAAESSSAVVQSRCNRPHLARCASTSASTTSRPSRRTRSSSSPSPHTSDDPSRPASPHDLSTVALGNLYESHCLSLLTSALPGLTLEKVGGAGDKGVDLRGWWELDAFQRAVGGQVLLSDDGAPARIRVLVQCKASKSGWDATGDGSTARSTATPEGPIKKLGPVILRELEGVLGRQRHHLARRMSLGDVDESEAAANESQESASDAAQQQQQTTQTPPTLIAILCSSAGFSKQTMLQTMSQVEENIILVHSALPPFAPPVSREPSPPPDVAAPSPPSDSTSEDEPSAPGVAQTGNLDLDLPSAVILSSSLRSSRGPLRGRLTVGTRRYLPVQSVVGGGTGGSAQGRRRKSNVEVGDADESIKGTKKRNKARGAAGAEGGARAFFMWAGREVRLRQRA